MRQPKKLIIILIVIVAVCFVILCIGPVRGTTTMNLNGPGSAWKTRLHGWSTRPLKSNEITGLIQTPAGQGFVGNCTLEVVPAPKFSFRMRDFIATRVPGAKPAVTAHVVYKPDPGESDNPGKMEFDVKPTDQNFKLSIQKAGGSITITAGSSFKVDLDN